MKQENILEMISKEAATGIAIGIREFLKHSLTITVLLMLLAGAVFLLHFTNQQHKHDREDWHRSLVAYSDSLNKANQEIYRMQQMLASCYAENRKQDIEIAELKITVRRITSHIKR